MDGRRSHPQRKSQDRNADTHQSYYAEGFGDPTLQVNTDVQAIDKTVDDPLVRQRAKQACDKCRAKKCAVSNSPNGRHAVSYKSSALEGISGTPVINVKDSVGCAISPNRRQHRMIAPCHYGIHAPHIDGIDFREFEAADEARGVLEWALEELYLRVRPYVDDLPADVTSLVPWLKATSLRPLPVYLGSTSRSAKKRWAHRFRILM